MTNWGYDGPGADIATVIVDLDDGGGYDWSEVKVWQRHIDGRLFMAADSGCSCNSLLSDVNGWDDLTPVNSSQQVLKAVDGIFRYSGQRLASSEVIDALRLVENALNQRWVVASETQAPATSMSGEPSIILDVSHPEWT